MLASLFDNIQEQANNSAELAVLDICTGAGGEALGLEAAGFTNAASVEIDPIACQTLHLNRPSWHVIESDIRAINGLDLGRRSPFE